MKKVMKRFLAYILDMMVVLVIAQSIAGLPFINKQLSEYNKYYKKYTEERNEYTEFKLELNNSFKDNKITEKEYHKIIDKKDNYKVFIEEFYQDKEISKKEYNTIHKNIDKYYQENYQKVYYQVEKNSLVYFIVYLITTMAYFIGFNYLTGGQTLGKKLLRLKIVNNKDENKKVAIWSYFVRYLILYQPIYYLVKLVGVLSLGSGDYYQVTSIVYEIQYYLEFIIILTIMMRADGRGLHDLLAQTRVVAYNKEGEEIDQKTSSFFTRRLDEKVANKTKKESKN